MTASTAKTYRPPTLADYPDLTPEEMGRRFLKLIDSLKTIDDLSQPHLEKVMQITLRPSPEGTGGGFIMTVSESGWKYLVSYYNNSKLAMNKNATYEFFHDSPDSKKNELPDMNDICRMDYHGYVAELKRMGFVEREEFAQYDTPQPPIIFDPETGKTIRDAPRSWRLPVYFFTRPGLMVQIHERREANEPEAKRNHACVERISVRRYDP